LLKANADEMWEQVVPDRHPEAVMYIARRADLVAAYKDQMLLISRSGYDSNKVISQRSPGQPAGQGSSQNPPASFAIISATREQCEKQFGQPFETMADGFMRFNAGDLVVEANFDVSNRVNNVGYRNSDPTKELTEEEIQLLLKANADEVWQPVGLEQHPDFRTYFAKNAYLVAAVLNKKTLMIGRGGDDPGKKSRQPVPTFPADHLATMFTRIGETRKQCEAHYGQPIAADGDMLEFKKNDMFVSVTFDSNSRVASIMYDLVGPTETFTAKAIQSLLQSAADEQWQRIDNVDATGQPGFFAPKAHLAATNEGSDLTIWRIGFMAERALGQRLPNEPVNQPTTATPSHRLDGF
jgi:hypothetical protein